MYLINTQTLRLEEFQSEEGLQYAILSHRWEDGEVTFQDMESGRAPTKPGFVKVQKCCEQARRRHLRYAWVDTCCIDKKSSAELSEAINSMYRWYQRSDVCYAFLSDVETLSSFHQSLWFTRGWTLQELLAPRRVRFYNSSWKCLGEKQGLHAYISEATKINQSILQNSMSVFDCSIAERMSWAAHRKTTRIEDRAYSLLGLFDVNMPLLYGEGEKAFIRLQEEIIRHSSDHSIFAWSLPTPPENRHFGLLAHSPEAFSEAIGIRSQVHSRMQSPYTATNQGLSVTLKLTPWTADTYVAFLQCFRMCDSINIGLGIFLRRLRQDDQYARVSYHDCSTILINNHLHREAQLTRNVTVYVKQNHHLTKGFGMITDSSAIGLLNYLDTPRPRIYGYRIIIPELRDIMKRVPQSFVEVPAGNDWDPNTSIMTMKEGGFGTVGILNLEMFDIDLRMIKLGFDFDHNPVVAIIEKTPSQSLAFESFCPMYSPAKPASVYSHNPSNSFLEGNDGIWAMQGDRVDGLHVKLLTSSRIRKENQEHDALWIRIQRATFNNMIVWELDIYDLIVPHTTTQILEQ
ncbi:HET-domain-containing protein [Xylaria bambusicola]|uniref:HET-domain-containing protein n=1 Tax=Xylaria bambusicola TaxID=326684 RepID=UPI002007DCBA|nr:HET-domain-containing protein [Xylaria bambusicola]KAI0506175.1 HET-domain-containing protein [Xylaria bambusicola]